MRSTMFAIVLLLFLIPVTPIVGVYRASSAAGTPQSASPSSGGTTTTGPPTGLHIIVKSIHGAAYLNFSGAAFTVFPATLFLNMTVLSSNSTGVSLSVDSGNVTEGYPGLACPAPTCTYRVWKVDSGNAYFYNIGILTISATTTETVPAGGVWFLSLKGPARMVQLTSASQATYELFALLFGRIYNSTASIGLLFLVGISAKLGDVDMDGRIDITDLVAVAVSFGTSFGEPNYNPYADVAMHGQVNIQDLAIVASNYGQTY